MSPKTLKRQPLPVNQIGEVIMDGVPPAFRTFLKANMDVQFIRYCWIDFSGILRARVLTKRRCLHIAARGIPIRLAPCSCTGLIPEILESFSHGGFEYVNPDWKSLRVLYPTHASVMCTVSGQNTALQEPVSLVDRCPRSTLGKVLDYVQKHQGIEFLAGFELEFFLVEEEKIKQGISTSLGKQPHFLNSSASALRGSSSKCLDGCVRRLEAAGVLVLQYHAENSNHQFEISTAPLPVMEAIDTFVQTKEIIQDEAVNHNYRAIFLPKPFRSEGTNGLHIHLSIHESGDVEQPIKRILTNAVQETQFLAGILQRLPLLCAFSMPYESSYSRLAPSVGEWVSWGTGNRETPIRRIDTAYWELRSIDCTANPYIVLAVYIASGVLGIENGSSLRLKDCQGPLSRLDSKARAQLNIDTAMPKNLHESMERLEHEGQSSYMSLDSLLGRPVLDQFLQVKKAEQRLLGGLGEEEMLDMLTAHF